MNATSTNATNLTRADCERLDTEDPLAGLYALFAGIVFLVLAGVMLAPVIHHVLHKFHMEIGKDDGKK